MRNAAQTWSQNEEANFVGGCGDDRWMREAAGRLP
jgi:hypothetical protein